MTQKGKKWSVNLGAVLGQMTTGGSLNRLNATLALLDLPGMYKRMFTATEALLGMEIMKQLATSMQKVATEEREHAISKNSYHQGIPAITGPAPASTMTAYVKSREKQLEKDRTRK